MASESRYRPGVCNIGGAERRRRYRYAAVAFAAAGLYAVAVTAAGAPPVLFVGVAVPVALGTEWLLQARRAFCARLAFAGRYAFGGVAGRVDNPDARRSDRNAGVRFVCAGLAAGALAAGVAYWLAVAI